jgi:hypothetical protein
MEMLHEVIIGWLRHEKKGITDREDILLKFDKLARVNFDQLATLFFDELKDQISDEIIQGQGANFLIHVMSWFPSKYIFWCDKADWNRSALRCKVPTMLSASVGHSRDVDLNKLCEKMFRESTDDFPHVFEHGTSWNALKGIFESSGLLPGGARLDPRPIHVETHARVGKGQVWRRTSGSIGRDNFTGPGEISTGMRRGP